MEGNDGIELCHVTTDEGDWAEITPQTVRMLLKYLKTDQYAVADQRSALRRPGAVGDQGLRFGSSFDGGRRLSVGAGKLCRNTARAVRG